MCDKLNISSKRTLKGLLIIAILGGMTSCASNQTIMVYGFGKQKVPPKATVDEINAIVRARYGTDLFWTR